MMLLDASRSEQESQRLAAVRRYEILDTPPDEAFDRITRIAAAVFEVPIAIVSLVDHDRIWFKSRHGLNLAQMQREPGLCASAILRDDPLILTDASLDPEALSNSLVSGAVGLRFYVGVPLRTADGFNLGTLSIIDRHPRKMTPEEIALLESFAGLVMDQMDLRLAARDAVAELSKVIREKETALKRAEVMAKEIDHRVMNSLQLISGLLRLHGRDLGEGEAGQQVAIAASRVAAIAKAHQHIYLTDGIERAECTAYLRRLCDDLSALLREAGSGEIRLQGVELMLPTSQLVAIGLIVNEIVTGAVKRGALSVAVALSGQPADGYTLSIATRGGSAAEVADGGSGDRLGPKVIAVLLEQIGGQLTPEPGGDVTIRFPGAGVPAAV